MSRIFLSHSSANAAEAIAMRDWLLAQGWDDVFLDLDPKRGLVAGERWQAALKSAGERCELVICLISPDWLRSKWCIAEFLVAKQINKRIVAVTVVPVDPADMPVELTAEWQVVDLAAGALTHRAEVNAPGVPQQTVAFSEDGLDRLRVGLQRAGIDARFFPWPPESDPHRSPYRGLRPLDPVDAGIFFGRDGAIVIGLDVLRGLRDSASPRILVVLGASGAGKSSYMRAGLWPRLERDNRNFLPLPVIRPDKAALSGETGLIASLQAALVKAGLRRNRADIQKDVASDTAATRLLLKDLQRADRAVFDSTGDDPPKPPIIVIPIDQAEELFHSEERDEAERFLTLLAELACSDDPAVITVFTIRSDNYERLQTASQLEGLRHQFLSLPPMPVGAYGEIIRGPARRLTESGRKLTIDEPLIDTMLRDIDRAGAKDALPILAFTLGRLYSEYSADGTLRLIEYKAIGRVSGSLEAAIEHALRNADAIPAIPRDRGARLALLRRGLIPWLAGIDHETGSARRRVARLAEIPLEARPLMLLLVDQRLLSTDRDSATGETTVEPAHEALLRHWPLEGWLKEDSARLATLEGVKRASSTWKDNSCRDEWLTHHAGRLEDAERLSERRDLAAKLDEVDCAYLAASRTREDAAARAKARTQWYKLLTALASAVVLAVVATIFGLLWNRADSARQEALHAQRSAIASLNVARSQLALREGDVDGAVMAALEGLSLLDTERTRSAALTAIIELSPHLAAVHHLPQQPATAVAWLNWRDVGVALRDGKVRRIAADAASGRSLNEAAGDPLAGTAGSRGPAPLHLVSIGNDRAAIVDEDGGVRVVSAEGDISPVALPPRPISVQAGQHSVAASLDGQTFFMVTFGNGVLVRNCRSIASAAPPACSDRTLDVHEPLSVAVSGDGGRIAIGTAGALAVHSLDGSRQETVLDIGGDVISLDWSADDALLSAGTRDGRLLVVAPKDSPLVVASETPTTGPLPTLRWAPSGSEIAYVCDGRDICISAVDPRGNLRTHPPGARLIGHRNVIDGLAWSPDGDRLATVGADNTLRIWSRLQDGQVFFDLPADPGTPLTSLAVDRNTGLMAAGDAQGIIWFSDGKTALTRLPTGAEADSAVIVLAWNASGELAAGYQGGTVAILHGEADEGTVDTWRLGKDSFARLTFAGDGTLLAIPLKADGRIALLNTATRKVSYLPRIPSGLDPWGAIGHPDGRRLFASYTDGSIHVWDVVAESHATILVTAETAGEMARGAGHLSLSSDGKWLAATRSDRLLVVYDVTGEAPPHRLELASRDTRMVAFSPDGSQLAALSSDRRLHVWDLTAGSVGPAVVTTAVPDGTPAGMSGSRAWAASWLDWLDDRRLVVATSAGRVHVIVLDADAWRLRASQVIVPGSHVGDLPLHRMPSAPLGE